VAGAGGIITPLLQQSFVTATCNSTELPAHNILLIINSLYHIILHGALSSPRHQFSRPSQTTKSHGTHCIYSVFFVSDNSFRCLPLSLNVPFVERQRNADGCFFCQSAHAHSSSFTRNLINFGDGFINLGDGFAKALARQPLTNARSHRIGINLKS